MPKKSFCKSFNLKTSLCRVLRICVVAFSCGISLFMGKLNGCVGETYLERHQRLDVQQWNTLKHAKIKFYHRYLIFVYVGSLVFGILGSLRHNRGRAEVFPQTLRARGVSFRNNLLGGDKFISIYLYQTIAAGVECSGYRARVIYQTMSFIFPGPTWLHVQRPWPSPSTRCC